MDQPNDPNITASSPEPQETNIRPPRSLFADDASPLTEPPARTAAPASIVKPRTKVWTRVVLPLAVFILGVGAIAWVVQYLPGRGKSVVPPPKASATNVLAFDREIDSHTESAWGVPGKHAPGYLAELELGTGGAYDFKFTNLTADDVELGLAGVSCTRCTKVEGCVFKDSQQLAAFQKARDAGAPTAPDSLQLQWVTMEAAKDLRKSITVPAKGAGLVRMHWDGSKTEPDLLNIDSKVWARSAGQTGERELHTLVVKAFYVRPLVFERGRDEIDLGGINPGELGTHSSFLCWSATRDLDVEGASEDKRLDVKVTRLPPEECAKMERRTFTDDGKEKELIVQSVRCAFRVDVTLFYESKDGKLLDMGQYKEQTPLKVASGGQRLQVMTPIIRAYVRGDVTLSAAEQGGRIDFQLFKAEYGARKKVKLYAPKDAKLSFVKSVPELLDVDVTIKEGKVDGTQREWDLDVAVRPRTDAGALPKDGVIVLRYELPAQGATPAANRLVSIPVVGTATRN